MKNSVIFVKIWIEIWWEFHDHHHHHHPLNNIMNGLFGSGFFCFSLLSIYLVLLLFLQFVYKWYMNYGRENDLFAFLFYFSFNFFFFFFFWPPSPQHSTTQHNSQPLLVKCCVHISSGSSELLCDHNAVVRIKWKLKCFFFLLLYWKYSIKKEKK